MKKYLIFRGEYYYPGQGLDDFKTSTDTLTEAMVWLKDNPADDSMWIKVYDRDTLREINIDD